uniref:Inner centromere protein ARK-binding domain-containing protein n=1 Tax=Globodera rostochiensis TaxID=31243 RepID=A0A914HI84_GLORO
MKNANSSTSNRMECENGQLVGSAQKKVDALKTVFSHVNWADYDQIMDNIFYNTFGKALEKKKEEFDETKKDLKQNVKRIFEDPKVMPSPSRKVKPAIALMKRINEFKELENTAKKEKELDRDKKAQKNREEQLKDKAERTKREREERAKRVQQNNQIKEAERKEQEEQLRARLTAAKKFADEQKKLAATPTDRTPKQQSNVRSCKKNERTPAVGAPKTPLKTPKTFEARTKIVNIAAKTEREINQIMVQPKFDKTPKKPMNHKAELKKTDGIAEIGRSPAFIALKGNANKCPKTPQKESKIVEAPKIVDAPKIVGAQKAPKIVGAQKASKIVEASIQIDSVDELESQKENETQEQSQDEVVDMTELEEVVEISAYDMTKDKIPIPSTEDNYNVDDLSSADETDPEDSPRKQIPKWAQKEALAPHILAIRSVQTVQNIEQYFGRIQQPTVLDFFKHIRKKYPKRRSSSAIWDSPMSDPTPGFGRFQKMFQQS